MSVDLRAGLSGIVVIDARSRDAYAAGQIPGAVSFPHREMSAAITAGLDRGKIYVVYCDGESQRIVTWGGFKDRASGGQTPAATADQPRFGKLMKRLAANAFSLSGAPRPVGALGVFGPPPLWRRR